MKKQILAGLIALGVTAGAYAQLGTVSFDNSDSDPTVRNPPPTLASTSFGLVFVCTGSSIIPLNQDINLTLLGGPSAGSLSQIASLTFATGTAQTDWSFFKLPGLFLDPKGLVYDVPGVAARGTAFLDVEAWLGNAPTYSAAIAEGSLVGNSGIFQSATGGGIYAPVSIGDGMPSFLVGECPEPSTLAFGGLGATALLLLCRRK